MTKFHNPETLRDENELFKCSECHRSFYTRLMFQFHTEKKHTLDFKPGTVNQDQIEHLQFNEQNRNSKSENAPISEEYTNKYKTENQLETRKGKNSHRILKSRNEPVHENYQKDPTSLNESESSKEDDMKDVRTNQIIVDLKEEFSLLREKIKSLQPPECDESLAINTNLQTNKNKFLNNDVHNNGVHEKLKSFQPPECDESLAKSQTLITDVHKKLKSFHPPECDESLAKSKTSITVVHEKLKQYQCQVCQKYFTNQMNFQIHKNSAHHFKPLKCSKCNKEYSDKDILAYHIRVYHKKVKPFKCQQCGVAYGQKLHLKTHFDVVHNKIKSYRCQECPKSYGRNNQLQDHIKTIHKKIKCYKCSFCPKSYGYRGQFDGHINLAHYELKNNKFLVTYC